MDENRYRAPQEWRGKQIAFVAVAALVYAAWVAVFWRMAAIDVIPKVITVVLVGVAFCYGFYRARRRAR